MGSRCNISVKVNGLQCLLFLLLNNFCPNHIVHINPHAKLKYMFSYFKESYMRLNTKWERDFPKDLSAVSYVYIIIYTLNNEWLVNEWLVTDLCYPLGPTGWHQNSRAASSADTATLAPDSRQHSLSCLPLGAESASGCQLYPGAAGWPDRTGSRPGWSESLCIGQTPVKK